MTFEPTAMIDRSPQIDPAADARCRGAAGRPRQPRGAPLLGFGVLLLLAAGLAIGVWRHYRAASRGRRRRGAAARLRPAAFASRQSARAPTLISVTLPATTIAFEAANIFARASGYIVQAQCRYRRSRQGGRAACGDHRARARPPDRPGAGDAGAEPGDTAPERRPTASSPRHLGARRRPGQAGWVTQQQGDTDRLNLAAQTQAAATQMPPTSRRSRPRSRCSSSKRPISGSSRRSTASSPSATSMSAAWCRPTRPAAPLCSR